MILSSVNTLSYIPRRIVSLVPSQTELLYHLGLIEETIGITKFCIHPKEWNLNKIKVGGTKTIDIQCIRKLNPDLIIANKEENTKEQIETLGLEFPVWLTDVNNLKEALEMISDIGKLTHKEPIAQTLIHQIQHQFATIPFPSANHSMLLNCCYLIWKSPYMTVGGDTFINDMIKLTGLKNCFAHKKRYPEVTIADMIEQDCKLLLLSSEPYPFKQKHIDELQAQLPGIPIILVNGEMFSWYGSRLSSAASYLKNLQSEINNFTLSK